jgi:hypothetical protein
MDFITNNSMMLILSAMDYIKMVMFEKLSVVVIREFISDGHGSAAQNY